MSIREMQLQKPRKPSSFPQNTVCIKKSLIIEFIIYIYIYIHTANQSINEHLMSFYLLPLLKTNIQEEEEEWSVGKESNSLDSSKKNRSGNEEQFHFLTFFIEAFSTSFLTNITPSCRSSSGTSVDYSKWILQKERGRESFAVALLVRTVGFSFFGKVSGFFIDK